MPRFSDIVGQTHIRQHLCSAIREDKVSHAYILSGEALAGKKWIADIFTQSLLCERRDDAMEPCGTCPACLKVQNGTHPDVRHIVHEKPASIRVREIIEQLVDDAVLTPYTAPRKVYIVPDAELMTPDAQNKLLKTLEEPPAYVTVLLLTTRTEALLPTIRSRCITLSLRPVDDETMISFLIRTRGLSDYKASLSAQLARGNTGRAIAYAEDAGFEARTTGTLKMLEGLQESGAGEIVAQLKEILAQSDNEKTAREDLLQTVRYAIRDALVYKATEREEDLILEAYREYIRDVAVRASYRDLLRADAALSRADSRIGANVNALLSLEMFLLEAREEHL